MKKFGVGAAITLLIAIVSGLVYLGRIEGRLEGIANGNDITRQRNEAVLQLKKMIADFKAAESAPEVPIGSIVAFSGRFTPDTLERLHGEGWLPCNGEAIHESNYSELYRVLGGTYGTSGDGGYLLPDLQGRVPMGAGQGLDLQPRERGQKLGLDSHMLTEEELPAHTHTYIKPDRNGNIEFDTFEKGDTEKAKAVRAETGPKGGSPHTGVARWRGPGRQGWGDGAFYRKRAARTEKGHKC